MSSSKVELQGQVSVDASCGPCEGGSTKLQQLSLRCTSEWFQSVVSTDVPIAVETAGAVGAAWQEVPTTDALDAVELLVVRTSAPMRLRIGADAAKLVGVGGAFPTGFAGGETLAVDVDGASLAVVFTAGAQSAQQVVNQINAAAALAGWVYLPASVVSGQVQIAGVATGSQGSVEVTGGTAQAVLGFGGGNDTAVGEGSDVDVYGLFVGEFGRGQATAPERVQVSGSGRVEVFAAGTPA